MKRGLRRPAALLSVLALATSVGPVRALASPRDSSVPQARQEALSHSGISLSIADAYGISVPAGSWAPVDVSVTNNTASVVVGELALKAPVAQLVQPGTQVCYSSTYGATVCSVAVGSGPWYAYAPLTEGYAAAPSTSVVTYRSQLAIAPGVTKDFVIDVLAAQPAGTVEAQVLATGGRQLAVARTRAPAASVTASPALLVVTDDPTSASALSLPMPDGGQPQVQLLPPAGLPASSSVLDAFAAVVVDDADTSTLSQEQGQALRGYVQAGGTLLVAGGAGWSAEIAGLPRSLLPATVVGTGALALGGLAHLLGSPPPSGQVPVDYLAQRAGAAAVLTEGHVPLAFKAAVGNGCAEFLAVDPARAPLALWPGQGALLGRLLAPAFQYEYYNQGASIAPGGRVISTIPVTAGLVGQRTELSSLMTPAMAASALGPYLEQMPGASLPPSWLLGLLLLAYVLIAGPSCYIALRRWRRREATWAVLPVFAIVAGLVAYATGAGMDRGALSDQLQVAVMSSGSHLAEVSSLGAVYLPQGGSSAVWLAGSGPVTDLGAAAGGHLTVAPGGQLTGAALSIAGPGDSLGGWASSDDVDLRGTLGGAVWDSGGSVVGTVTNHLGVALKDAFVVEAYVESSNIGTIPAGGSANFKMPVPSRQPGASWVVPFVGSPFLPSSTHGFAAARQQAALQGLSELAAEYSGASNGPVLVALAAKPFVASERSGSRSAAVDAIVLPLQPEERSQWKISDMAPELVGSRGVTAGAGSLYGSLVLGKGGSLDYEFILPGADWHRLRLNFGSADGSTTLGSGSTPGLGVSTGALGSVNGAVVGVDADDFSVSAFNFANAAWERLPVSLGGGDITANLANAARLVGPGGAVEVQLRSAVANLEVIGQVPALSAAPGRSPVSGTRAR